MSRNTWAVAGATLVVVAAVIFGLRDLGGPKTQRLVQADLRTLQALSALAQQIQVSWSNAGKVLPADLGQFPVVMKTNPITHQPFAYHARSGTGYELCATFLTASRNLPDQNPPDPWAHPQGDYCFQLDVTRPSMLSPQYY